MIERGWARTDGGRAPMGAMRIQQGQEEFRGISMRRRECQEMCNKPIPDKLSRVRSGLRSSTRKLSHEGNRDMFEKAPNLGTIVGTARKDVIKYLPSCYYAESIYFPYPSTVIRTQ